MVRAPNESDEELRRRHVTSAVASDDQELASSEALSIAFFLRCTFSAFLDEEDAPQG